MDSDDEETMPDFIQEVVAARSSEKVSRIPGLQDSWSLEGIQSQGSILPARRFFEEHGSLAVADIVRCVSKESDLAHDYL